jgi:hypothetical protein
MAFLASMNAGREGTHCPVAAATDANELRRIMMKPPGHFAALLAAVSMLALAGSARADDAVAILKAMSDYIGAQKNVSASFDSDIEVMTTDLEKIQFTSSGRFELTRPDKLHVIRTGGYADIELFYDGKTVALRDRAHEVAAKVPAPATIDALVDDMRDKLGVEAPGADLLFSKVGDELMQDVIEAKHIGRGVVDGVECEHLAFRNADVDWQLWVEVGSKPVPHKYIITSKTVTGAPQYTLRIGKWSDAPVDAAAFSLKEDGVKLVELKNLDLADEVPPGTIMGKKQ